jgi:uncharacterized repeat protein (TIGR01451 family)
MNATGGTSGRQIRLDGQAKFIPDAGFIGVICFDAYFQKKDTSSYQITDWITNSFVVDGSEEGTNVVQVKISVGGGNGDCNTTGIFNNAPLVANTVTVTSGTTDLNTANNTATAIDKLCASSDVEILSITDSVTAINASTATSYVSTIKNNGVSPVSAVSFTFSYDNTFIATPSFVASVGTLGTSTSATVGTIVTVTNTITGINLASGASMTVTASSTILAGAVDGQSYSSTFTALPTEKTYDDCTIVDPNTANNLGNDSTVYTAVADMSITKVSSGGGSSITNNIGTVYAGGQVTYTIAVANGGPSTAAANIVVTDTMPSQVTPVIASGANYTSSANWNCTFAIPTMTCVNTNPMLNGGTSNIVLLGDVTSVLP